MGLWTPTKTGAFLRKSGAGSARVRLSDEAAGEEGIPLAAQEDPVFPGQEDPAERVWQESGWEEIRGAEKAVRAMRDEPQEDEERRVWETARIFADRLEAAADNL